MFVYIFIHLKVFSNLPCDFLVFRSVLFNFHILVNSTDSFLVLISNFTPVWPKNILGTLSIILNLLRLVLWLNIILISWSLLENVQLCI